MGSYSFENIRIILPVKLDQSAVANGTVIFTWRPAKKIELVSFGLVVAEAWGPTASTVSLEVNDVEQGAKTIAGGTALGTEVNFEFSPPVDVAANAKIEFVAKDVTLEAGEGYFLLEYREIP